MATSDTSPSNERDDVSALKQLVSSQAARIAILEEQLRLATARTFAPKSEKLSALAQLDLFNEAETFAASPDAPAEAQEIKVPEHTRARWPRGSRSMHRCRACGSSTTFRMPTRNARAAAR